LKLREHGVEADIWNEENMVLNKFLELGEHVPEVDTGVRRPW